MQALMHFNFLASMLVEKAKDRITPGEKVFPSGGNGNKYRPLLRVKIALYFA